jgi:hypothetical protein
MRVSGAVAFSSVSLDDGTVQTFLKELSFAFITAD